VGHIPDEVQPGLSAPVEASVERAVNTLKEEYLASPADFTP